MIQIGRNIRHENDYLLEVEFTKKSGFDFIQIWYDKNGLSLKTEGPDKEKVILEASFPTIIHALLDINEYELHIPKLLKILNRLNHNELIIHPVFKSQKIDSNSIGKLARIMRGVNTTLKANNISLYIENNCRVTPIFYSTKDIEIFFVENPDVNFLLDVAHIDNYDHFENILKIKYPRILHIADKRFSVEHEHLALGKGEIDYSRIFEALRDFNGKVILEISDSDQEIFQSKCIIEAKIRNLTSSIIK